MQKIQKKDDRTSSVYKLTTPYATLGEYNIGAFEKGVEWADNHSNSQWISVNDDLPYNHKELIVIENVCTKRVIAFDGDDFSLKSMIMTEGKWHWIHSTKVKYWMPIPNLPK